MPTPLPFYPFRQNMTYFRHPPLPLPPASSPEPATIATEGSAPRSCCRSASSSSSSADRFWLSSSRPCAAVRVFGGGGWRCVVCVRKEIYVGTVRVPSIGRRGLGSDQVSTCMYILVCTPTPDRAHLELGGLEPALVQIHHSHVLQLRQVLLK